MIIIIIIMAMPTYPGVAGNGKLIIKNYDNNDQAHVPKCWCCREWQRLRRLKSDGLVRTIALQFGVQGHSADARRVTRDTRLRGLWRFKGYWVNNFTPYNMYGSMAA